MSNDHLNAHFRVIFDRLTASHRAALEELRDGCAALDRASAKGKLQPTGLRMPDADFEDSLQTETERLLEEQP